MLREKNGGEDEAGECRVEHHRDILAVLYTRLLVSEHANHTSPVLQPWSQHSTGDRTGLIPHVKVDCNPE